MSTEEFNAHDFGYPHACGRCDDLRPSCSLKVAPFHRSGGETRLMLVGQDPTIYLSQERVKCALMLDEEDGQITKWLRSFLGEVYNKATIYGTNAIKCTFEQPPSLAKTKLAPYFMQCGDQLQREIALFRPTLLLTFGEQAHQLFTQICESPGARLPKDMKRAFTGNLHDVCVSGHRFRYSPCLHIKTFRVAEAYGETVAEFKRTLRSQATDA